MIKLSKTGSGLTQMQQEQQRGIRSAISPASQPLPSSSSSSSSSVSSTSTVAAPDVSVVADSLSVVESHVCRELMVDKFNRVSCVTASVYNF